MKVKGNTVPEFLTQLKLYFLGKVVHPKYTTAEEPLRSELFSSEHMDQHAMILARSHKVTLKRTPDKLLRRLADNERVLVEVRNLIKESVKENYQITPAGEWLLDNFYLIEEQIRTAKKHLPRL